jgi:hypothetical protein
MGLLIKGQTECQICGQVIETFDESTSFPAFLGKAHPSIAILTAASTRGA